jgi:hypothetical protein
MRFIAGFAEQIKREATYWDASPTDDDAASRPFAMIHVWTGALRAASAKTFKADPRGRIFFYLSGAQAAAQLLLGQDFD